MDTNGTKIPLPSYIHPDPLHLSHIWDSCSTPSRHLKSTFIFSFLFSVFLLHSHLPAHQICFIPYLLFHHGNTFLSDFRVSKTCPNITASSKKPTATLVLKTERRADNIKGILCKSKVITKSQ